MKRTLSIILALVMIISLLPTAFAAEKNLTPKQSAFEYSFTASAFDLTKSPTDQTTLIDLEANPKVSDQWNPVLRYGVNWMQTAILSGNYTNYTVRIDNAKKNYCVVAFKINIASAGTFIPKLNYMSIESGYIHDIYLVKSNENVKPVGLVSQEERDAILGLITEDSYIGTVDTYGKTSEWTSASLDPVTIAEGEEGDYILILNANGYNEKVAPYVPAGRTDKFVHGYLKGFELTADFNAAAVENGELNYNMGMDAINGAQMLTANSVDINNDGTADITWDTAPILRGSSGIGTLNYVPVMNWWSTTPYGNDFATTKIEADPPIQVMNLANTDPWAVEYFDAYNNRMTMNSANSKVDAAMYYNIRTGTTANPVSYMGVNADGSSSGDTRAFSYFILFKVIIPYAGEYDLSFTPSTQAREDGVVPAVYFFPVRGTNITSAATARSRIASASANEKLGHVNFSNKDIPGTLDKVPVRVSAPRAGEYYIAVRPDENSPKYNSKTTASGSITYQYAYFCGIKLAPVANTADYMTDIDASVSKAALTAGETAKMEVSADYKKASTSALTSGVSFRSSADSVASVDANGNITAHRQGSALISAVADNGMVDSKWVTVSDAEEKKSVSYAIANNVNSGISIKSGTRGDSVTVTAEDMDGYTFRHWVRGSADNGSWVSSDKSFSFKLMTNTCLTAVYSKNSTDKIVEFFNENGEYYAAAKADESGKVDLPADPTRTGFKFAKWLLSEDEEFTAETIVTADITRAVARYEDTGATFSVKSPVGSDSETASYSYDDKITLSSSYLYNDKTLTPYVYWYRNGKQVDYGTEYTYYVWDAATITHSYTGTNAPLVVLDSSVKSGNAYMIEYDAAGKQVIEVGILFGTSGRKPTIESCDMKATSQKTEEHGQFTARVNDDDAIARGYLIYNDNGTYRVVYSD